MMRLSSALNERGGSSSILFVMVVVFVVLLSPSLAFQGNLPSKTATRNSCDRGFGSRFHERSSFGVRLYESASASTAIRDRLGLHDRFDRWRFLQRLLDEESKEDDVNQITYWVLDGYLKYPRPTFGTSSETGSPELTPERRNLIEEFLSDCSSGLVPVLAEDGADEERLSRMQLLLPDPVEDEDAHKGLWDTIIELNGRESVKINETNGLPEWRAVCLIARVIVHYDFLTYGLIDTPFQ